MDHQPTWDELWNRIPGGKPSSFVQLGERLRAAPPEPPPPPEPPKPVTLQEWQDHLQLSPQEARRWAFFYFLVKDGKLSEFPGQRHYDAMREREWFTSVVRPA